MQGARGNIMETLLSNPQLYTLTLLCSYAITPLYPLAYGGTLKFSLLHPNSHPHTQGLQ